jgi:hypothetical protein
MTLTGLPADPSLAVGGAPMIFTLVITNGTAVPYTDFMPIVSIGHCSCIHTPVAMAPDGTLELRQNDGTWMTIPYDREGTGTDYLYVNQVSPVTLLTGQSISFTYRIRINASQVPTVTNGETSLDIVLENMPGNMPILGASSKTPVRISAG